MNNLHTIDTRDDEEGVLPYLSATKALNLPIESGKCNYECLHVYNHNADMNTTVSTTLFGSYVDKQCTTEGESLPNGATVNGATANGATVNGETANGATVNGATANGATVNGATVDEVGTTTVDESSVILKGMLHTKSH